MGEKVFLLNQVKVKNFQKTHSRLQLQKVSRCCRPSALPSCAGLSSATSRGRGPGSTAPASHPCRTKPASLQNYTSIPAGPAVLFTLLQHIVQIDPKSSHREGAIGSKIAIHSCCMFLFYFLKTKNPTGNTT